MPYEGTWPTLALCQQRGATGPASCSGSSRMGRIAEFPPVARGILEVLARQHSAIGAELGSIQKSILAWHRSCEESRRLEEIPGIGPIVATARCRDRRLEGVRVGTRSCRLDRGATICLALPTR